MGVRNLKPVTPGSRFASRADFSELTTDKPEKSLTVALRKKGGRNNTGRITVRRRGGGHRRRYRIVDYKRDKFDVKGKVATIEYDPNRSAYISLIHYEDGEKRYILAPLDLPVGSQIISGEKVPLKVGNALKLFNIPTGLLVHNIEMVPGKGGQMVRSAGGYAQIMAHGNGFTTLKLPSGEIRLVSDKCMATIGQLSAVDTKNVKLGKAGRKRHLGRRPEDRGVAMAPNAHPHGGGEGRSPIGMPGPKTPWGKPALGLRTRKKNKPSNKFIVRRRYNK